MVKGRGQAGALTSPKTDYATWGGMITFDSRASWNFTTGNPTSGQYDFESVALHEMMHVFGFGLGEPAFTRNVVNDVFVGPTVLAVNGGVGVRTEGSPPDHFAQGTKYQGQEDPMQPALAPGVKRSLTALDYAALDDTGWDVAWTPAVAAPPAGAPVASATVSAESASSPLVGVPFSNVKFAVGTANAAVVYGQFGEVVRTVVPFGPGYTAGVRVASADLTGDGVPELIAATGPGVVNAVQVYDGRTGTQIAGLQPYEAAFTGGLNLAVGDVTRDGIADLVATPDLTGGPVVAVFDGAALGRGQAVQVNRFFGLDDPNFRGGVRPALGDLNGDGVPDLALAAGFGGGPRVALFDGRSLAPGLNNGDPTPRKLTGDFFAFDSSLRNGTYLAVADVNGDGTAELVAGAGPGGGPRVTAFDAFRLVRGGLSVVNNFFAGDVNDRHGVRLGAADINSDGRPELLASVGGQAIAYSAVAVTTGTTPLPLLTVTAPGGPAALDGNLSVG